MTTILYRSPRRLRWLTKAAAVISDGLEAIARWREVDRQRVDLASFNDRTLRDIGLSRADVEREYRKPFW